MNSTAVIDRIRSHAQEIQHRFNVASLELFGSFARGQAKEGSDLDVLVHFQDRTTFDGYMDLKFYLEDLLGLPVDLVTEKALKPIVARSIKGELIRVA